MQRENLITKRKAYIEKLSNDIKTLDPEQKKIMQAKLKKYRKQLDDQVNGPERQRKVALKKQGSQPKGTGWEIARLMKEQSSDASVLQQNLDLYLQKQKEDVMQYTEMIASSNKKEAGKILKRLLDRLNAMEGIQVKYKDNSTKTANQLIFDIFYTRLQEESKVKPRALDWEHPQDIQDTTDNATSSSPSWAHVLRNPPSGFGAGAAGGGRATSDNGDPVGLPEYDPSLIPVDIRDLNASMYVDIISNLHERLLRLGLS